MEFIDDLLSLLSVRTDQTVETGKGGAAKVELGPLIRHVSIHFDSTGNATMTVEVSNDGASWQELDTVTRNDDQDIDPYDVRWRWVRAYADDNLGQIIISAKGGL